MILIRFSKVYRNSGLKIFKFVDTRYDCENTCENNSMMAKILGCTVQEIEYNTKDIGVEIVLLWGDYIKLEFERLKIDR